MQLELGADRVPFLKIGDYQLRLDLEDFNDEYKERAKVELGETPEVVESALQKFRENILREKDLHIPLDDDRFLLKFLRPFKFDTDGAFRVLTNFYKFKKKYPKYGLNITPGTVRHVFDNEVFVFLPTRTPCGSRIMVINAGTKWNPKIVPLRDMFRGIMIAIEIAMLEPKTHIGGAEVIINMEGLSLSHVTQFSPLLAKLIMDWVQNCAPVRLKGIHIINGSAFFKMVYSIFKPFIGERLKRRLHFHGCDKKSLFDKIPSECLPESLGGTGGLGDYPGKLLSDMFYHYEDLFIQFNTYCYSKNKISTTD